MLRLTTEEALRFIRKIRVTEFGCWEWTGPKTGGNSKRKDSGGYPRFFLRGKHKLAHRVIHEAVYGPIKGQLDHKCRNRACVRPRCLEDVTALVNTHRALVTKYRVGNVLTHCVNGHEFTPADVQRYKGGGQRICRVCKREQDHRYRQKGGEILRVRARGYSHRYHQKKKGILS